MYDEDANTTKLKIALLNITVQITALKKSSYSLQKHFNVKRMVDEVQRKFLLGKEERKLFQEDATRLLEDFMKLMQDAEKIQDGVRSLNAVFTQLTKKGSHHIEAPSKSCISFSDEVDKRIDDIVSNLRGNCGPAAGIAHCSKNAASGTSKIQSHCESDDEIDDTTVQVAKNSTVKTPEKTPLPEILPPTQVTVVEDDEDDEDDEGEDEPIRYGRGYKTLCQSPRNKVVSPTLPLVEQEKVVPVTLSTSNPFQVQDSQKFWDDRCFTSDSVSLASLSEDDEAHFSSTSFITTTCTTTTTTTTKGAIKSGADNVMDAIAPPRRATKRRRGRISKNESELILSVVKSCRYRQNAWTQLESMLGRSVNAIKEHYVNKMHS